MMSPGPPPQPIYPHQARNAIPSSSPMAQSPRPMPSAVFQPHNHPQLPPPIFGGSQVAAVHFSGPVLAPLANPCSGASAGGPVLPPPVQSQQPSTHIPPQNTLPPQHVPSPLQTRGKNEGNQVSNRFARLMPSQPFPSPASSGYPSPSPFSVDQSYGSRRFSGDSGPERRRSSISAMIPSPTYTAKRSIDEGFSDEHQQQQQPSGYGPRFTPASVEDVATTRREAPVQRSPGRYQIQVRQQPVAARACGFGERDRRVIDPPPIVQLIINDSAGNSDPTEMRYPFNVVHCTLWSTDGQSDETALIGMDKRQTRRLMGTLVSSPFGCFFCFPDLSCRTHGKYRLRFVLMRLEPSDLQPEGYTPIITETLSDIFTVYTAKEFPGMRPSTSLTKALKRQGCAISVKKGNEKALGGAPGGSGKDEGSGDDTPSTAAGKPKRRRKT
ncbi:unnamed protein product [Tuber melanosporum]|uniref:(Perigord truffle) hypothetical protein n=1 Tax=Tuber melanosporum (strain Mel28) TaxID=656061 RepID=D5GLM1_TUBMM|nr:uncharacterized protein GSTUM_00010268001 [Tuber melanosporum]CAZ85414.1 unnamed protein product [Tuber melanosporum]